MRPLQHSLSRSLVTILALVTSLTTACAVDNNNASEATSADEIRVCASGTTVEGVDVSIYQGGSIDWNAVHASGREFAITRINDGVGSIDPTFHRNWDGIRAAGMIRGAYQFYRPNHDANAQADIVCSALGRLGDGDLPAMLDLEASGGASRGAIVASITTWLHRVEGCTGKRPIIYTAGWFWDPSVGSNDFGDYGLVVAAYGPTCPSLPTGWSTWRMFQYSDGEERYTPGVGSVPGIGQSVDRDRFNGSLADLRAFANGGPAPAAERLARTPQIVARNSDGRLEVFVRGTDNAIYHNWQTAPNGGWSGWWPMGGAALDQPVVGHNADGRLEIFWASIYGTVWHQWQLRGGGWSDPTMFDGMIATDSPAVATNADGRMEIFFHGPDNRILHAWQSAPNGGWTGAWPLAEGAVSTPSVAANADGRLEVFFLGIFGTVWHTWQDPHGAGGWSHETIMEGAISTSVPSVIANSDGRLELFLHGLDNTITHTWQSAPNGGWSGVFPLTGGILTAPTVAREHDGRLRVFYGSIYGVVFTTVQDPAGHGGWSDPVLVTGVISTAAVGVGTNQDGRLEIFARDADGTPTHAWENSPGASWTGPHGMGGAAAAW
jgi:GH25 family lysozyme M1 (1,4-beta-N-acetylmuramidase)